MNPHDLAYYGPEGKPQPTPAAPVDVDRLVERLSNAGLSGMGPSASLLMYTIKVLDALQRDLAAANERAERAEAAFIERGKSLNTWIADCDEARAELARHRDAMNSARASCFAALSYTGDSACQTRIEQAISAIDAALVARSTEGGGA